MADKKFKAIIDHPEKTGIISRLVSGESPRDVVTYLKTKYNKPDEKHLILSIKLLKEFIDTYGAHYGNVKAIVKKDADSKLDKHIAESLLDNKEWRERIAEVADDEIDLKKKMKHLVTILEARAEQIFDLIQANPENTKADYIFTKYTEQLATVFEKADKLINNKADITIEHNYTVQMVEQQSVVFQEAIRRVLNRMSPEDSVYFMDCLREEMSKLKPEHIPTPQKTDKMFAKERSGVDALLSDGIELGVEIDGVLEENSDV